MRFTSFRAGIAMVALLFSLTAGCDDGPTILPEPTLILTNNTDRFELQAVDMAQFSRTLEYDWENTTGAALVTVVGGIVEGTATLEVRDAAGAVVYDQALASGTAQVNAGPAGTWRVIVVFENARGSMGISVVAT